MRFNRRFSILGPVRKVKGHADSRRVRLRAQCQILAREKYNTDAAKAFNLLAILSLKEGTAYASALIYTVYSSKIRSLVLFSDIW